VPALQDWTL